MTDSPLTRKPAEVHFRDPDRGAVTYDHVDRQGAWLVTVSDDDNGGMPTVWFGGEIERYDKLPPTETSSAGAQGASEESAVETVTDPAEEEQAYIDAMQGWFAQAAGVNGFDPSIVDLSWGTADGEEGVIVELSPFGAGYWKDGEWQDKDGFEDEKETAKETVLKPRDEFEYHGEPDYLNFIKESDIDEVVS